MGCRVYDERQLFWTAIAEGVDQDVGESGAAKARYENGRSIRYVGESLCGRAGSFVDRHRWCALPLWSDFPRLLRWNDVRDSSHQGSWNELDQFVNRELPVVLVFVDRARDLAIVVGVVVRFLGVEDLAVHILRRVRAQIRDHRRHELG